MRAVNSTAVIMGLLLARLATAATPVTVTARDVSLKVNGGKDYRMFQGHTADQYERDMMEGALMSVWLPKVIAYMRSMPSCSGYMGNAWSQLPVITRRLDVVNQYRGGVLRGADWRVTDGGRHYQIEYYQMAHAQSCSLGSRGKTPCAQNPLMTPDLLDLLDMRIVDGECIKGADFEPPMEQEDYSSRKSIVGLTQGDMIFPILDAESEAALKAAEDAHMAGMCDAPPSPISVKEAQNKFISLALDVIEAHFRTPPPFTGGCDPLWSKEQCCGWKVREHHEYTAWAHAVRMGRWGEADCFGGRHKRMHICANLYGPYAIRMPPCVYGEYPDDTDMVTCQQYLENPQP